MEDRIPILNQIQQLHLNKLNGAFLRWLQVLLSDSWTLYLNNLLYKNGNGLQMQAVS